MKILALLIPIIALAGCQEKGPIIDFGAQVLDTSFITTAESPQQRMVLIEEFTGVSCPNCPAGHEQIKTFESDNPGRMAVIGIQIFNNTQANPVDHPPFKTINDNRTQIGTNLCNGIFGTNNTLPSAGIDRTPLKGSLILGRKDWPAIVDTRLSIPAKANIALTSTYDAASHNVHLKVHIAYTSAIISNQSLTVALIEDNVIDAQEFTLFDPVQFEQNYTHHNVLRDILTSATGTAILNNVPTKSAGQVYERTFVYTLPGNVLNPDNCSFVAFVSNNNGADKEVVQAAEVKLK